MPATLILAANPNRWGFMVSASIQSPYTISFGQPLIGQNGHIFVPGGATGMQLWLGVDTVGPAVWEAIYACDTLSGSQNLGIVEVIEIG